MEFDETTFGKIYAEEYDELHDPGTTEASVALIAELASGDRLLEFAIGTGRMALPLLKRGFQISGIEGSAEMAAKLHEKPGGEDICIEIGDMATTKTEGEFDFSFLVFNTLFNLTSQSAQIQLFKNAAEHLTPGGRFLIETFVPDMDRFDDTNSVRALNVGFQSAWLEATDHDPVQQRVNIQRIRFSPGSTNLFPLQMRYAWPQEIDLMAQLAGLELEHRWGGWHREPFTRDSKMHVSLYHKPQG